MPIQLEFKIVQNTFLANVNSTKQRVEEGMMKGMELGANELRDYLKNDALAGGIVNKRTGQLAKSLYVKRSKNKLTILFRGMRSRESGESPGQELSNAQLAGILEYGLNKSWWQPKRNRWHRGIQAHYFMRQGISRKRARIIQLVKQNVHLAVRNRTTPS